MDETGRSGKLRSAEDGAIVGEHWTKDQKLRLKELGICPVRSSPKRLKDLVSYFRTPGASLFEISEGNGPLHVSKYLGRKIRNYQAEGKLDWLFDESTERIKQGYDTEWRGLLLSHPTEFSQSIDAYRQDLGRQIQTAEIHLGLRAGFMPPKVPYGPLHWPFIESIFSRGLELAETRREFELALGKGAIAEARKLSKKIGVELASRIAI